MKLLAKNFNIAYGKNGNGLTVEHDNNMFSLDQTTMVNIVAGNSYDDWDDADGEHDIIAEIIENFVKNNHEEKNISMWFD